MDINPQELDPNPEDFMQPSEMSNLEKTPMGPIVDAVQQRKALLINLRSNRKLYGYVKAVDRHWNMIIENATEIWDELLQNGRTTTHQRNINRLFLRGDNVISVLPNPEPPA